MCLFCAAHSERVHRRSCGRLERLWCPHVVPARLGTISEKFGRLGGVAWAGLLQPLAGFHKLQACSFGANLGCGLGEMRVRPRPHLRPTLVARPAWGCRPSRGRFRSDLGQVRCGAGSNTKMTPEVASAPSLRVAPNPPWAPRRGRASVPVVSSAPSLGVRRRRGQACSEPQTPDPVAHGAAGRVPVWGAGWENFASSPLVVVRRRCGGAAVPSRRMFSRVVGIRQNLVDWICLGLRQARPQGVRQLGLRPRNRPKTFQIGFIAQTRTRTAKHLPPPSLERASIMR